MLIVDDSPVVLEILDTIFTPHCGAVVTAENVA
jgi:hypothetical protein